MPGLHVTLKKQVIERPKLRDGHCSLLDTSNRAGQKCSDHFGICSGHRRHAMDVLSPAKTESIHSLHLHVHEGMGLQDLKWLP